MGKTAVPPSSDRKPSRSSLFSAKTEYALIALLELARHHGDPMPLRLKAISDKHHISHRFLVQILLQLKGSGLVVSTRGASGGYHLGHPPEAISISDVVQVIDPPESSRSDDEGTTPIVRAIHGIWAQVSHAQHAILKATSLADLLARADGGAELSFHI